MTERPIIRQTGASFTYPRARRLTYVGLVTAIFVFAVINLAIVLPTSPESPLGGDVFKSVIGSSVRLYIASLAAYLIGQLLDISIFFFVRRVTGERFLWLRSTGSTVISQAIDSLTVGFVFYLGHGILHRHFHVREVLVKDPAPPEPADELVPS